MLLEGHTTYLLGKSKSHMQTQVEFEKWVRVPEVADHLNVSTSYINKAVLYSNIPVRRVGRNLRFRLSDVDQWVEGDAHGLA